jgi:DnaJ-class molecular chaperone
MKNYYKILELDEAGEITEDDIKRAYRKLAIKYHPDKILPDEKDEYKKSGEAFRDILEAYTILSNEEERVKYDQIYKSGDTKQWFDFVSRLIPGLERAKETSLKVGIDLWNLINKIYDTSIKREQYSIFESISVEMVDVYNRTEIPVIIPRKKARIIEKENGLPTLEYFVENDRIEILVDSLDEQLEYPSCGNIIPPPNQLKTRDEYKRYIRDKSNYGNLIINIQIVVNGKTHIYKRPEYINYDKTHMLYLQENSPWIINTSDILYFKVINIYQAITDICIDITLPSGEIKKVYHSNILQNMMYKKDGCGLPVDGGRGDMYVKFLIDVPTEHIEKIGEMMLEKK